MSTFEDEIRAMTRPLNEQYPRPWMTDLTDPTQAQVFIVGKNQAKGYPVTVVGSHERHLDALFNRNGETCRQMYGVVTGGKASPTRRNIDGLTRRLARRGVVAVLETNVVCYSTPMSADLATDAHVGGRERGQEIFRALLRHIRPQVLISHGADTAKQLEKLLNIPLPLAPKAPSEPRRTRGGTMSIYVLPSLAPPAYNSWSRWAPAFLDRLADLVASELKVTDGPSAV